MSRNLAPYITLALLSAISLGGYLLFSWQTNGLGYPLDDAWIHQTYARNLVEHGEWAFVPGNPSAGSTSPLWSGLLAFGYLARFSPYVWTYFLGWLFLSGLAFAGYRFLKTLTPISDRWALAGGFFLALEWHLVWAAGAGMETIVHAFLAVLSFAWLLRLEKRYFLGPGSQLIENPPSRNWLGLGALAGLGVWVRPDALTLLGPAGLVAVLLIRGWQARIKALIQVGMGFSLLFLPYLVFNLLLDGTLLPNTFYAKQAEYAILTATPLLYRFLQQALLPLVGAGAVLLPGFAYFLYDAARRRSWVPLAAALWVAGFLGLYAWRLPVTYQHGRYVIPAMPVYFLLGLAGLALIAQPGSSQIYRRVLSRAWILSLGLVSLAFWVLGARAYAQDVAIIESEMVATANWVNANTEQDTLIAAHDIGALGYFGERQLLDLAGLVSPQVIPFIRDEAALAEYLDSQGADYLVTFPGWYPSLVEGLHMVYQTRGDYSPALGGENMVVYRWNKPVD